MPSKSYYLLGPMTGYPKHNREAFETAAADLRSRGFEIVSPVELDAKSGFDFESDLSRDEYLSFLRRDIRLIADLMAKGKMAGGIALPGWQGSGGARLEVNTIRALGGELMRFPDLGPLRHPGSERFHQILQEIGELHDRKAADYGSADDPFANVRASEEWGMAPWIGGMVRLNDKVNRLKSFAKTGILQNEGAIDSFLDIAVYALICLVLFEEGKSRKASAA